MSAKPKAADSFESQFPGDRRTLLYQPGTVWEYGLSTDVLGLVIEKVSGTSLGDYLKAELWEKVGMPQTGFVVMASSRANLSTADERTRVWRDAKFA